MRTIERHEYAFGIDARHNRVGDYLDLKRDIDAREAKGPTLMRCGCCRQITHDGGVPDVDQFARTIGHLRGVLAKVWADADRLTCGHWREFGTVRAGAD